MVQFCSEFMTTFHLCKDSLLTTSALSMFLNNVSHATVLLVSCCQEHLLTKPVGKRVKRLLLMFGIILCCFQQNTNFIILFSFFKLNQDKTRI